MLDFIKTYCVGLMIDDAPSPRYEQAISECEYALGQSRPYNIELGRGSGKTSLVEMAILYVLSTARRKYCVIIAQSYSSAQNILKDCWQPIIEPDTAFATDHPEICLPYQICTGSYRRRQLYRGETTDL